MEGKQVYKAIVAVQADLAKEGISKDRTCTQGASYKFRGIDDIYNAISPVLSAHGLCILPRMIRRECVERTSAKGNALFYTTVEAEFDFVSAEDGSMHTARTFGEAMDSGDKGTNKAMSAAYKYAAFQTFCIPTEGDNDTENQTHEVKSRNTASGGNFSNKTAQPKQPYTPPPENGTIGTVDPQNSNSGHDAAWYIKTVSAECKNIPELEAWWMDNSADIEKLGKVGRDKVLAECAKLKKKYSAPATWTCPRGGDVTAVDCGECGAMADCEVAKTNIKEK